MEILRVKYADSFLPESDIFAGGNRDKMVPIIFSVFLIITKERKILVDTGCEKITGYITENIRNPLDVLKEMTINTSEITDVIITHSHLDHIGLVSEFKNAAVYITKEEYEQGKQYIAKSQKVCLVEEEYSVTEEIKIVKIGGHSEGSCIIEVEIQGETTVLCGDECYSFYNLKYGVPAAVSCATEKSRAFIKKYSGTQYHCLLCHDEEGV